MNDIYFIQKRDNRLKGKSNDKQDLCSTELDISDIEANADRSWIITHTQSEILDIKFVKFLFRIDRRRGRKSLQDYLRKNHEIFKLQVNLSLKYQSIFFF